MKTTIEIVWKKNFSDFRIAADSNELVEINLNYVLDKNDLFNSINTQLFKKYNHYFNLKDYMIVK